jgi:opacity protein-like surface antigen
MKTLIVALLVLSGSAQAADLTFACTGSNLVLDQVQTIAYSQDQITINGLMNGQPYSVVGKYSRTYTNSGFAFSTVYGEVVVPFELVNGARAVADVTISNNDYRDEVMSCSIQK